MSKGNKKGDNMPKEIHKKANWSNGLTKETDERVRKRAEAYKKTYKKRMQKEKGRRQYNEYRQYKYGYKNYNKNVYKLRSNAISAFEKVIIALIKKYNLPYNYTGDGLIWIGGRNPDFMHKDKKITIEVYHTVNKKLTYSYPYDYETVRKAHFAKYGYVIKFINENDLFGKDYEQKCLNKINN